MSAKSRGFVLTCNNPLENHEAILLDMPFSFLVFQYEMGELGTPHLQGYVRFPNPISVSSLRDNLLGYHVDIAKGSASQNLHYCSKPVYNCLCTHCNGAIRLDGPYEYGERPERCELKAKKLSVTAQLILYSQNHSVRECVEAFPSAVRLQSALRAYQQSRIPSRYLSRPPYVIILYGISDAGKTRYVHDNHVSVYKVKCPINGGQIWFDNYCQQEALLLDDWRLVEDTKKVLYYEMLDLLDRYQYTGQMKGVYGGCQVNSPFIYITNNDAPHHWFGGHGLMNLSRRITATGFCTPKQPILLTKHVFTNVQYSGVVPENKNNV